jgi:riboflavin-specific deaminase-like protein
MINESVSQITQYIRNKWLDSSNGLPNLPHVTLTYAQSINGSIASGAGVRTCISGNDSLILTHSLRSIHDAILVGIGTLLSDDPQLNVRFAPQSLDMLSHQPQPVILDSCLRTPISCKLLVNENCVKPIIFCSDDPSLSDRKVALEKAGAKIFTLKCVNELAENRILCLSDVCSKVRELGYCRLMVEGGSSVIDSFFSTRYRYLISSVVITIAPKFIFGGLRVGKGTHPPGQPGEVVDLALDSQGSAGIWVPCGSDIIFVASHFVLSTLSNH